MGRLFRFPCRSQASEAATKATFPRSRGKNGLPPNRPNSRNTAWDGIMKTISHIISGRPLAATGHLPVFNPATGEQTGEVASGGAAEIAAAVKAAQSAQPDWAGATPARRAKIK